MKNAIIKQRLAKKSNRGIYIQDRELLSTTFKPGTSYRYVIDTKNHKLIILAANEINASRKGKQINTVSKKKLNDTNVSVIDIRSSSALSAFKDSDYLQITIFEDKVTVEGFKNDDKLTSVKTVDLIKAKLNKVRNNILGIQGITNVRRQSVITMSLNEINKQVVGLGSFGQVSIEDWIQEINSLKDSSLKQKIKHIDIPLKIVSLFSGAGMMDKAFVDEGFDIVFAVEMNKSACETYRHNINNNIYCSDITKMDKSIIPNAPIIIGGSPCQGMSNENRITNYLDNPKNLLVREYIDVVKKNKDCMVFVLENVPQIITVGNGKFKNEILKELSDFEITYGVMSALKYGSPQDRKRAIFIGSKIGKIEIPKPTVDEGNYMTVRKAFAGLNDDILNQTDISKPKDITLKRIKCVPEGGNIFDIPEEIRPKGKHSDMYKRLNWDKPSITIVNPSKAVIIHPERDRILSIRECARLFGESDDFIYLGSLPEKLQQVANGVPYHLADAVAKAVKNAIVNYNKKIDVSFV